MRKKVFQKDVAKLAGVDRTTVSKILTGYPHDTFPADTIQKVFEAARKLSYQHVALLDPKRRSSKRKRVQLRAKVMCYLDGGRPFGEYQSRVVDIAVNGMLLEQLEGEKHLLPADPFYFEIELAGPFLEGMRCRAVPIRFVKDGKRLGLAVEIQDLTPLDREKIANYVNSL